MDYDYNDRENWTVICDRCGNETLDDVQRLSNEPIYCDDCAAILY